MTTGADVDFDPGKGVYTVRLAAVSNSADAGAVLEGLKAAFTHWQASDPSEPFFRHRIEVGNITSTGLPLDADTLHPDYREGKFEYPYLVDALQPGWFWLHVANLPDGASVVRDWLAFARAAAKEAAATNKDLWESDTGLGLGGAAALTLALHDLTWVEDYAAMLPHWDLSHEVHEQTAINAMFAKYGWSRAMRTLLIARVSTDGQHHTQQVFHDMRALLADLLPSKEFTTFYHAALTAFRAENLAWLTWPPTETSCRAFGIDGPLLEIANALPAHNLETP